VEKTHPDYPFKTPRVLFRNLGKRQVRGADGGWTRHRRSALQPGVAFGDFDNDGDVDILIMNVNEPPSLLRNDVSGGGHWLKVGLTGTKSNRSAIGARVDRHLRRAAASAGGDGAVGLSVGQRPALHFGLGAAQSADLEIWWPNGLQETIKAVAADRLVSIREGAGVVKVESFGGQRAGR